jgi:hypothetical protein
MNNCPNWQPRSGFLRVGRRFNAGDFVAHRGRRRVATLEASAPWPQAWLRHATPWWTIAQAMNGLATVEKSLRDYKELGFVFHQNREVIYPNRP